MVLASVTEFHIHVVLYKPVMNKIPPAAMHNALFRVSLNDDDVNPALNQLINFLHVLVFMTRIGSTTYTYEILIETSESRGNFPHYNSSIL
jgi:hypothetical protein